MKSHQEPGDAPAFRAVTACFNREAALRSPGDSSSQMLYRDGLLAAAAFAGEIIPSGCILKANG